MKRTTPTALGLALMLGLPVFVFGQPLPRFIVDTVKHYVKPAVNVYPFIIKSVALSKNGRPDFKQKIQSSLLEVMSLYDYNKFIPDTSVSIDTSFKSKARIDDAGRVDIYIYIKNDSTLQSAFTGLNALRILPFSWNDSMKIITAWVYPNLIDSIGKFPSVRYITLVKNPIMGGASTYIRSDVSRQIWHHAHGKGITVGVLSNDCGTHSSDPSIQDLLTHLHPQVIDDSYSSSQDHLHEGLAMMDVINDIADSASLVFATGCQDMPSFVNNIDALISNGCNIITDDIHFEEEPSLTTGYIEKKIDQVVKEQGIVYTTMAGNFATDVYSFNFSPVPNPTGNALPAGVTIQDRNSPNFTSGITISANSSADVILQWDDPYTNSTNDFDLYLIDAVNPNNLVGESTTIQSGINPTNAWECVTITNPNNFAILVFPVVVRASDGFDNPTPRMKLIFYDDHAHPASGGSILGHNGCESAITCAAIKAELNNYTSIEPYSSQGKVLRVNTSALVNSSGNRPLERTINKPDVSAVDGITTNVNTFSNFPGTSAAAPEVAGLAAQLISVHNAVLGNHKQMTPNEVKQAIFSGCIDYGNPGWDSVYGYGRVDAFRTIAKWLAKTSPNEHFAYFDTSVSKTMVSSDQLTITRTFDPKKTQIKDIHEAYISVTIDGSGMMDNFALSLTSPNSVTLFSPQTIQAMSPNLVFSDNATDKLVSHLNSGIACFGLVKPEQIILPPTPSTILGKGWTLTLSSNSLQNNIVKDWGVYIR